jgi:hypothetical protein
LPGRVNAKVAKEVAKSLLAIRAAKFENAASKFGCLCRNPRPTASKIGRFKGQFRGGKPVKPTASTGFMERAMGIEPKSSLP